MEWLREIFERLLSIFPRILILAPYEAGIRITFGKRVTKLGAGWYIYWPLIQKIIWMEIQTQVVDLRAQSVQTKDVATIIVSGAIQYRINDVYKACVNVQDIDKSLESLALGIILEFVKNRTLVECENIDNLKNEILKGIREAASGWGVKIEKVFMTDLGRTRNIRLLTNPVIQRGLTEI